MLSNYIKHSRVMYGLEIPNDALEMFFPPFLGNASIGVASLTTLNLATS